MSSPAVFFLRIVAPAFSIALALLGLETLRSNVVGWFLLAFGIAYPAGGIIHTFIHQKPFWQSSRPGEPAMEETGDLSFWMILPGFLVVFFVPPLEWVYLHGWMPHETWMQITGSGVILISIALLIWARIYLRNQYSGHVEVVTGHRLVLNGPYRFIRHPSYTGFLLMTFGVAVSYASLIGLAAIPLLLLPGLVYRMRVEEKLLTEQFGDEYRAYAHRSKKLIPGIW
jgi:protein-S-isoprenylcysteine O-methyltransferase Ste14